MKEYSKVFANRFFEKCTAILINAKNRNFIAAISNRSSFSHAACPNNSIRNVKKEFPKINMSALYEFIYHLNTYALLRNIEGYFGTNTLN